MAILWCSFHTDDPAGQPHQSYGEAKYRGYHRIPIKIDISKDSIAGFHTFPACFGGSEVLRFFALGSNASGTGHRIISGPVEPDIPTSHGVTPALRRIDLSSQSKEKVLQYVESPKYRREKRRKSKGYLPVKTS